MGAPGAGAPMKFLTQWNSYTRMHYYPARMRRGKVISLSVRLSIYLSVRLLSPRKSPDLDIYAPKQLVSVTNRSESATNWLECA